MKTKPLSLAIALSVVATGARADHIEELVVTASHDQRTVEVTDAINVSPDVAQLLKNAPGMNVNSNGPLTGIPQYRGMYGPRISTTLDGTYLASAGPNAMDPPLSYATGGQLESLVIYRGIAPVSVAQESIGGAVEAKNYSGDFSENGDVAVSGRIIATGQTVNSGTHLNAAVYAGTANQRFKVSAMTETGDDAQFPGGEILPTEYERQRYDLGYGLRVGAHTLQIDYGYNDTGDAGTPALPMDIETIEGDLYRVNYLFDASDSVSIDTTVFGSNLDHTMTNYHLRSAPPAPRWRRNIASSDNWGLKSALRFGVDDDYWKFGVDAFDESHDSDIENPNNPMFFVVNFNAAERQVLGAFAERSQPWGERGHMEFGLRYNYISMDAGEVDGAPARMNPAAGALRDAFNEADRSKTDSNVDMAIKSWFAATDRSSIYIGFAHKTRSPSYQERYLWLPLEATGGLADGLLYTGNIDLEPEVSRQIEIGLDFSGSALTISPRVFYNNINDYIQGTPADISPAIMFVQMMNGMNGTNNPPPLQFNNVDAELYGFDMDWAWQLSSHWSVSGLFNYVRGKRQDINDNLYRIAPPNATLRLHYTSVAWRAELEGVAYAKQDNVSATNLEQQSDGYGIVNALVSWQATEQLQVSAGVDNLLDEKYQPHLGGYNRAQNPDVALRDRLPAPGINAFARVHYTF
ncbi:MAG: TonB-dependent receptor [Gammaproteobacteria bacterium]|nr:TonB-dependent receptor [Gammaproteobacteria bacterium]